MKAALDDRFRRSGVPFSGKQLLWAKFFYKPTAHFDWEPLLDFLDQIPGFSFSEAVSISGTHKWLFDHLQSNPSNLQMYDDMPDIDDDDYFNIPRAMNRRAAEYCLTYAAEVLAYAYHSDCLGLSADNECHTNLITGWFLEEAKPRLLGKFFEAYAEIGELPQEFWRSL